MDRVEDDSIRLRGPDLANVFVGRESAESFEPPGEVVSCYKVPEVRAELIVAVVVEALDRCGFR